MADAMDVAPIFAVSDLGAALAHYRRLGFTTSTYEGGGYGFAVRDGAEIHLGVVDEAARRPGSAYLFVRDADGLAAEWSASGIELHPPVDTPWGRREGVVVDPDGNVIRFGSPLRRPSG